jgi:hypothetical protein
MAKTKAQALPRRIYVNRETDATDDSSWLSAHEDLDSIDGGATVGVYELKETRTMNVSRTLK